MSLEVHVLSGVGSEAVYAGAAPDGVCRIAFRSWQEPQSVLVMSHHFEDILVVSALHGRLRLVEYEISSSCFLLFIVVTEMTGVDLG